MRSRSPLILIGACLLLVCLGGFAIRFWQRDRFQHETYMYPPEVLVPKYLKIDHDKRSSEDGISSLLDIHRSLLILAYKFDTEIKEYNFDLSLEREIPCASWNDYRESVYPKLPDFYPYQEVHRSDDYWAGLGDIYYGFDPEKSEWSLGARIADLPPSKPQSDPNSGSMPFRWIVSHRALPSFKDLAIHLDGQISIQNAASYTGDNLFGVSKKHPTTMPFFTGTWILLVQGEPVLRQKVRNLCLGAYGLQYSPVYGLVRFDYQAHVGDGDDRGTLYILKVKASGPDVYKGMKSHTDADSVTN